MKKPTINPVKTPDNSLNKSIAAVKEIIEIREGDRGDPDERFVRVKDLVDSGMATKVVLPGGVFRDESGDPGFIGTNDGDDTDGAITVFDVVSGVADFNITTNFFSVMLTWTYPDYRGHAYTEIYRSPTAATGSEQWLARAHGSMHVDSVDPSSTNYYWVRHVNINGEEGPLNPVGAGLEGTTSKTVADMLTEAGETIVASGLATSLLSSFNSIQYTDSAPSTKQDGRALIAGDKYVTSTKDEYIYTGSAWIKTTIDTSSFITSLPDLSGYLTSSSLNGYLTSASASGTYATSTSVLNNVNVYYEPNSSTITGQKTGDIWVDTSTTSFTVGAITYNNQIKYTTSKWTGSAWLVFESSEINKAILSAANAESIAGGKAKIHISPSRPTTLTASDKGDMWVDPATDQIEFWDGNSWEDLDYVNAAAVTTKITEQVGYCTFDSGTGTNSSSVHQASFTTKSSCLDNNPNANGTYVWHPSGVIAEKALTAFSTANGFSTTIGQHTTSINGIYGRYQVKIENNGRVSGFGLSSTANPTTLNVDTAFIINADKFAVMNSTDTSGKTTSPSSVNTPFIIKTTGEHVLKRYTSPSYRNGWEVSANRSGGGTGTYYVTDEGDYFWNSTYVADYNANSSKSKTDANGDFDYVWVPSKTEVALNADVVIKKASIGAAQIQGVLSTSILKVNGEAWINKADIDEATIDALTISSFIKSATWDGNINYTPHVDSANPNPVNDYPDSTSASSGSSSTAGFYIDKYHCYFNDDTTFGNDVTIKGTLDTATIKNNCTIIDPDGYTMLTTSVLHGSHRETTDIPIAAFSGSSHSISDIGQAMFVCTGSEFGTDPALAENHMISSTKSSIGITASAVVEHNLSLWFRSKVAGGAYSAWTFLAETYSPEGGYGPVVLNYGSSYGALGSNTVTTWQIGLAPMSSPLSYGGNFQHSGGNNIRDGGSGPYVWSRTKSSMELISWNLTITNF